ncbi:pilus assembly protein TadG-related protein [Xylophilus sp. GW821-FHT01B05]
MQARSITARTLRRERGQAMAFGLVFLAAGSAALYLAFNAGQLSFAKSKLQNTADAAAYSAAVLQARDYNFSAYANRAMVANQVAVAQMVSLASWSQEMKDSYTGTSPGQTIVDIFGDQSAIQWNMPKRTGAAVVRMADPIISKATAIATPALGLLISSLSQAQSAYHTATLTTLPLLADQIARRNQPDSSVSSGYFFGPRNLVQVGKWKRFTQQYDARAGQSDRFADVVTDGDTLDGFIKDRGTTTRTMGHLGSAYKGCKGAFAAFLGLALTHGGGTQLTQDRSRWQGLDATDEEGALTCWWATPAGPVGFVMPLAFSHGRGGAGTGSGSSYVERSGYGSYRNFGGTLLNPATFIAANLQYQSGTGSSLDARSQGLRPYQELTAQARPAAGQDDNFNRAPHITIEVERPGASLGTSSRLLADAGRLQQDDKLASNSMRALASASAYFIRPDDRSGLAGRLRSAAQWARADGRFEYPSLFNPYWQASLTPTTDTEKLAAIAMQVAGGVP